VALSAFADKSSPPPADELALTLGRASVAWNRLKDLIAVSFAPVTAEWGFTSKTTGWGLRLKRPERTVLYMIPCRGYFLASFALGEKAVSATRASGLPASILEAVDRAPKFAEGRGVRLEVRTVRDVEHVAALATIKMAH
jgi:hypothetical protein